MSKTLKIAFLVIVTSSMGFILGLLFHEFYKVNLVLETIDQSRGLRNLIDRFGMIAVLDQNLKELNGIEDMVELERKI